MVPEFTAEDLAQLQAEDSEIGAAYRVLEEGLDPSPDELRGFLLESRALLSLQPEMGWREMCWLRVSTRPPV